MLVLCRFWTAALLRDGDVTVTGPRPPQPPVAPRPGPAPAAPEPPVAPAATPTGPVDQVQMGQDGQTAAGRARQELEDGAPALRPETLAGMQEEVEALERALDGAGAGRPPMKPPDPGGGQAVKAESRPDPSRPAGQLTPAQRDEFQRRFALDLRLDGRDMAWLRQQITSGNVSSGEVDRVLQAAGLNREDAQRLAHVLTGSDEVFQQAFRGSQITSTTDLANHGALRDITFAREEGGGLRLTEAERYDLSRPEGVEGLPAGSGARWESPGLHDDHTFQQVQVGIPGVCVLDIGGSVSGPAREYRVSVRGHEVTVMVPQRAIPPGPNGEKMTVPRIDQIAAALAALDDRELAELRLVSVNPEPSLHNERTRERLGRPDHAAGADAGNHRVNIYPSRNGQEDWGHLASTMVHESGHLLTERMEALHPDLLDRWRRAIENDQASPSNYGNAAWKEDLAETYALLRREGPEYLAARMPHRAELLLRLLQELDAQGR